MGGDRVPIMLAVRRLSKSALWKVAKHESHST